jgi:serine/threonine protein phosphatase PrpC
MTYSVAPLIHARTYDADFRVLVAPVDLSDAELAWARERIVITTRSAELLGDGPRWSVFRTERLTIFGVTCQASDVSHDMNRDVQGRPLYVYLGLAARQPLPTACERELAGLAELYSHVRDQWFVPQARTHLIRVQYKPYQLTASPLASSTSALLQQRRVAVVRDEESTRLDMWNEAFTAKQPVSVCLGLARLADVDAELLDGATVRGLPSSQVLLDKPTTPQSTTGPERPRSLAFCDFLVVVGRTVASAVEGLADSIGSWRSDDKSVDRGFQPGPRWRPRETEKDPANAHCATESQRTHGDTHEAATTAATCSTKQPEGPLADNHKEATLLASSESDVESLQVAVVAVSHVGAVRSRNEDSVVVGERILDTVASHALSEQSDTRANFVVAIADGMGGHDGGAVASRMVAEFTRDALRTGECTEQYLENMLRNANQRLFAAMQADPRLQGMGSTIAGVFCRGDRALVFNVGDSRVYRLQEHLLQQLTVDDTPQPMSYGKDLENHDVRPSALTQAIGGADRFVDIRPHIRHIRLRAGTTLLICSDGLFDGVPHERLEKALVGDLRESLQNLTQAALDAGGRDNISLALLAFSS